MSLRFFLSYILTLATFTTYSQSILINEVQTSNSKFLDEDGDTPDWFEIENVSNITLDLSGWTCSDDLSEPAKWIFPEVELSPNTFMQVWASGKDKRIIGSARTLIDQGDTFKYLTPNSNPPANWKTIDFDDESWNNGTSGFGYGDGDDQTVIVTGSRSVYLRSVFTIEDITKIEQLIFHIDYDDAFVAYLNGIEIARANIEGTNPSYNTNATTDHEAQMYQGGSPDVFDLDQFQDLLLDGENILAIQGHNVNGFSSDFTIIPFLSARYNSISNEGQIANPILGLKDLNLHTNFKLSSSGESLYLFDQNQILSDSIFISKSCPDISYGRSITNADLVYFESPTPQSQNSFESYEDILTEDVSFSKLGGPTSATSISLTSPSNNTIRYTLDATIPNINSTVYSDPIEINVSTVLRAKVFGADQVSCKVNTETYLIGVDHDLPIVSLVSAPENLFDDVFGIYSYGNNYEPWFPHMGANFWQDWEIPMHASLFETDGINRYTFDGGGKIFGGYSRANDQRSFSLFARSQYGQSEIKYPVFENRPYDTYQSLVLRNSGNDWTISNIRDASLTSIMEGSGLEIQANKPVVAYINTEYWGLYHLREKINEHYIASKTGADIETIDLLELEGVAVHGDNNDYLDLMAFLQANSLSDENNYQFVEDKIDIDNFIVYNLANIYFDNRDWPGNNIKFWKADGFKWRWLMYDTDFGFGIWNATAYTQNTLNFALQANGPNWPNPPWSTFMFRKLNESQKFKHRFINRFADELNTRFLPQSVVFNIDQAVTKVSSEIPDHFNRWGQNSNGWNSEINEMKTFGINRHPRVKGHIRDTYNLHAFHTITIKNNATEKGYVRLNSLTLTTNNWSGDYFQSVPIDVIAIPKDGYKFSHWEGDINNTEQAIQIDLQSPMTVIPVFVSVQEDFAKIIINEINYNASIDHNTEDWVELHNRSQDILDLSNWELKDNNDDHRFLIPDGTLIEPFDYLVIAKDMEAFSSLHPQITNLLGDFNFGLSSAADQVRLYNKAGELVGDISYTDESPWPEAADGDGYTLELLHPDFEGTEPSNWGPVHLYGSPGKTNLESTLVNQQTQISRFEVYPNPAKEELNFKITFQNKTNLLIELFDLNGRKLGTLIHSPFSSGSQNIQARLSNLDSGNYFLKVFEDGLFTRTLKFVKI